MAPHLASSSDGICLCIPLTAEQDGNIRSGLSTEEQYRSSLLFHGCLEEQSAWFYNSGEENGTPENVQLQLYTFESTNLLTFSLIVRVLLSVMAGGVRTSSRAAELPVWI